MNIVKLRPNADAQAVRFGAPWVFVDNIVMDRRAMAIEPGTIVHIHDKHDIYQATGAFNPLSKIAFRSMSRDPSEEINSQWLLTKLTRALKLRETLYASPFYRLIHAEGDGLPGLVIDRFGDTAVMQPNAAWADVMSADIASCLTQLGIKNVIKNASGRSRKLEGLDDVSEAIAGEMQGVLPVDMNGASYFADLAEGQKTGLFFDQRDNHAFAARLAKGADVLDVFSHVGGFGLAALAGGAKSVIAVDGSQPALDLAIKGAQAMGHGANFTTIKSDAFDAMANLELEGKTFDIVVCDPPAFAPNKGALGAGLRAYERVAMMATKLVKPEGYLVVCSCSHAATPDKFAASSMRGVGRAGRFAQIIHRGAAGSDHPTHPHLIESGYLKSIFMRLD